MRRPAHPALAVSSAFAELAVPLTFIVSVTACPSPPMRLPGQPADASPWGDIRLPDTAVPDGFVITQIAADGGTSTIDPSVACADASDPDATLQADAAMASDAAADAMACPASIAPGDLVFDEVMISTEEGSSDPGQWLEVRSTRRCATDLIGLHASAPHGQSFRTLDIATDVWLPPMGFFLIADTTDPTENNGLPGVVLAWEGSPPDALHKTSDTVTLSVGGVTIDTLSYPDKKRPEATSMSFPAGCAPGLRSDFTSWQPSTASWTPGFYGTPGAPNTDVICPVSPIPTCTVTRKVRR